MANGALKLTVAKKSFAKDFARAMIGQSKPVARAAQKAVEVAGGNLKRRARVNIALAGFSKRWQNAYRVNIYPKGGKKSIDAAAWAFHGIHYSDIYETGATIAGKPFMWIRLTTTPKKVARKKMTPTNLERATGTTLVRLKGSNPPLLGAPILTTAANAKRAIPRVTIPMIKAGARGPVKGKKLITAILFVGVRSVTIKKRFNIRPLFHRARAELANLYTQHFRDK